MAAFQSLNSSRPRARTPRLTRLAAILLPPLLLIGCATGGASPSVPSVASVAPAATLGTAAPSPSAAAFPVTVTDDEGTSVAIAAEPEKIVSLSPAATEILYAIGAGSRVVGKVQDPFNYPPEAASVPEVASFKGVEVEKIVSARADLVVSGGTDFGQGPAVEQLRRAKVPVLVIAPQRTSDVIANIRLLGQATGETEAAETMAGSIASQLDELRAATASGDHPKLFYEIDTFGKIYTARRGSFIEEMLQIAGGDPVTTTAPDSVIPLEKLIEANPTLILLGDTASGVTAAQVKARPGWGPIAAVKTGRIVPVNDEVITRPGPRIVQGVVELLHAIHPDLALPSNVPSLPPTAAPSAAP